MNQDSEGGVEMVSTTNDRPTRTHADAPVDSDQLARQQAIKQIERRRHYWISTAISTVGMLVLATVWAITEYHNAGGWPTHGFSQSSGTHDVWNIWIIYPAIAWTFLTIAAGLGIYLRRPIPESQIRREIERQSRRRTDWPPAPARRLDLPIAAPVGEPCSVPPSSSFTPARKLNLPASAYRA